MFGNLNHKIRVMSRKLDKKAKLHVEKILAEHARTN